MEWSTAAVGFGSALLGAMLGFAGTVYRTNQEQSRREKGVIRALLGELLENTTVATQATTGLEALGSFSTAVWSDAKLQIAQLTSGALFGVLLGSYSTIWVAEDSMKRLKAGDVDAVLTMELWYRSAQDAYRLLLAEFHGPTTEGWKDMPDFVPLRNLKQDTEQTERA